MQPSVRRSRRTRARRPSRFHRRFGAAWDCSPDSGHIGHHETAGRRVGDLSVLISPGAAPLPGKWAPSIPGARDTYWSRAAIPRPRDGFCGRWSEIALAHDVARPFSPVLAIGAESPHYENAKLQGTGKMPVLRKARRLVVARASSPVPTRLRHGHPESKQRRNCHAPSRAAPRSDPPGGRADARECERNRWRRRWRAGHRRRTRGTGGWQSPRSSLKQRC